MALDYKTAYARYGRMSGLSQQYFDGSNVKAGYSTVASQQNPNPVYTYRHKTSNKGGGFTYGDPVNVYKQDAPVAAPAPAPAPAPPAPAPYKPTPLPVQNKTPPAYDPAKDPVLQGYIKDLNDLKVSTQAGNKKYQDQIDSLNNILGNQKSSFADLQSMYSKQLKIYEDSKATYDNNYKTLQDKNSKQYADAQAQWQSQLNEQQQANLLKFNQQNANFTGQLNDQKSSYEEILKSSQSAWDKKYTDQQGQYDSKFNQLTAGFEQQTAAQLAGFKEQTAANQKGFEQQTAANQKRFQDQFATQQGKFDASYNDLSDQFTKSTAKYDGMIDELKIENTKNLSNMDAAFRASMKPLSQSAVGIKSKKSKLNQSGASSMGTTQLSRNTISNPLTIANLNL